MELESIEPKYQNECAICFASDNNYVKYLSVAIESIILSSNSNKKYDVVILSNGINDTEIENINKLIISVNNFSIRFIDCKKYINFNLNNRNHISSTAYYRLLIPDIFSKYSKVIYLDCDLIVNLDILQMLNIDLEKYAIGAIRNYIYSSWCFEKNFYSRKLRRYLKEVIGINDIYKYINTGVLIFNIKELPNLNSNNLLTIAQDKKFVGLDEDVINFAFKGQIKLIDPRWNVMVAESFNYDKMKSHILPKEIQMEYIVSHKDPFIIHFAGKQQPMYNENVEYADLFWKIAKNTSYYNDFKKTEGEYKKRIKFKFRKILNRLIPRNSKRWAFIKKYFRMKGGVKLD